MPLSLLKGVKTCSSKRCEQVNPQSLEEFYTSKTEKDGLTRHCKKCCHWYSLRNRTRFYEKTLAKQKEYRLKTRYGISPEKWDEMFAAQCGCCKICGLHSSQLKKTLFTDHCHTIGTVRGLLCEQCNFLIGYAKDDIHIFRAAIAYLKEHK